MWCVVHVDSFHLVLTSFSVHDNHVTKRLSHDVALCDSRSEGIGYGVYVLVMDLWKLFDLVDQSLDKHI